MGNVGHLQAQLLVPFKRHFFPGLVCLHKSPVVKAHSLFKNIDSKPVQKHIGMLACFNTRTTGLRKMP